MFICNFCIHSWISSPKGSKRRSFLWCDVKKDFTNEWCPEYKYPLDENDPEDILTYREYYKKYEVQ